LTNTALSGARLYWENFGKFWFFNAKGVSIPAAVHFAAWSSLSSCLLRFALASDHRAKVAKATQSRLSAQIDNPRAESMDSALFFLLHLAVT